MNTLDVYQFILEHTHILIAFAIGIGIVHGAKEIMGGNK